MLHDVYVLGIQVLDVAMKILENASTTSAWTLWGQALDATSIIIKTVGRDKCRVEAETLLHHIAEV